MGNIPKENRNAINKSDLSALIGLWYIVFSEMYGRGLFFIVGYVLKQPVYWQALLFLTLVLFFIFFGLHLISRFRNKMDGIFGKIFGLTLALWLFVSVLMMLAVWYKRWLTA